MSRPRPCRAPVPLQCPFQNLAGCPQDCKSRITAVDQGALQMKCRFSCRDEEPPPAPSSSVHTVPLLQLRCCSQCTGFGRALTCRYGCCARCTCQACLQPHMCREAELWQSSDSILLGTAEGCHLYSHSAECWVPEMQLVPHERQHTWYQDSESTWSLRYGACRRCWKADPVLVRVPQLASIDPATRCCRQLVQTKNADAHTTKKEMKQAGCWRLSGIPGGTSMQPEPQ